MVVHLRIANKGDQVAEFICESAAVLLNTLFDIRSFDGNVPNDVEVGGQALPTLSR